MENHIKENPSAGICLSIARPTIDEGIAELKTGESGADVFEIRLDAMERPEIGPFFSATEKPLLFTNRPIWEGGLFGGDEEERLELLVEAIEKGASFVDIELNAKSSSISRIVDACQDRQAKVICSWHEFSSTPSKNALLQILQRQYQSKADIGKIVTTAKQVNDVLDVLSLQSDAAEFNFPLIAFCMGKSGAISRLATIKLGGFMTYAAPDSGQGTAPGQMPISRLRQMVEFFADGT